MQVISYINCFVYISSNLQLFLFSFLLFVLFLHCPFYCFQLKPRVFFISYLIHELAYVPYFPTHTLHIFHINIISSYIFNPHLHCISYPLIPPHPPTHLISSQSSHPLPIPTCVCSGSSSRRLGLERTERRPLTSCVYMWAWSWGSVSSRSSAPRPARLGWDCASWRALRRLKIRGLFEF